MRVMRCTYYYLSRITALLFRFDFFRDPIANTFPFFKREKAKQNEWCEKKVYYKIPIESREPKKKERARSSHRIIAGDTCIHTQPYNTHARLYIHTHISCVDADITSGGVMWRGRENRGGPAGPPNIYVPVQRACVREMQHAAAREPAASSRKGVRFTYAGSELYWILMASDVNEPLRFGEVSGFWESNFIILRVVVVVVKIQFCKKGFLCKLWESSYSICGS